MNFELPKHTQSAVDDICRAEGVHLLEVIIRGSEQRRVVEIIVDSETGVSLDACGILNRHIGDVLDADNVFPASYRLEVSSPGIDRPLTFPWQFRKNIGRLLELTNQDGTQSLGRLLKVNDTTIVIGPKSSAKRFDAVPEAERIEIALSDIVNATVQIEW